MRRLSLEPLTDPRDGISARRARYLPEIDAVPLIIGLIAVALFAAWGLHDAGTDPVDWLLGTLLLTGILAAVVVGSGGLPRRLGRSETVALVAMSALTVWAFASIAWADVRGDAWYGADRLLLYLATFSLFLVLRWRTTTAMVVLAAYVLGVAGVAVLTLARASSGDTDLFLAGRLSYPTGYPNANAAFFLSAFWVALVLATRRSTGVPLRVAAATAATLLAQIALLSQSRATLAAFPVTALLLLLVLPGRVRTGTGVTVSIVVVAVTWSTHVAVFDAAENGGLDLETVVERSCGLIAVTSAVIALATLVWALVDNRALLSHRRQRLLERFAIVAGAVALVGATAAVVTAVAVTDGTKAHFSAGFGAYNNRGDFWRVAMDGFEQNPLLGIGADNFSVDYIRDRRSDEEPAYPHSLEIMVLSQLGLVGGLLFVAFLGAAGVAVLPRGHEEPAATTVVGAALAGSMYFFVHASVDWFWEIPALGAPAFALLGLALSVRTCARRGEAVSSVRAPAPVLGIAVAVAGAAAVACALPWLSQRQIDRALAVWRSDPNSAYAHLERARSLDPLSAQPDLVAGVIAARLDDRARMLALFRRSLERNPRSWYAQLEHGLAESVVGRQQAAIEGVRRAIELNPRDPLLRKLVARLEQGERISPRSLDQLFLERVASRTANGAR